MNLLVFARLAVVESARRRLLWALVVLTVVIALLTGWAFDRLAAIVREQGLDESEVRLGVSQLVILVAFMFSFVLTMTAAFLGAPAIGAQIESGVALAVVARPVRRSTVLVGSWLGLCVIVAGYAVGSGLVEMAIVRMVTGYLPPDPGGAVVFLSAEAIVLLTLALVTGVWLSPIASGAIAVVVFGLTWVAGVLGGIGLLFDVPALVAAADTSRYLVPVDGLWRAVVWSLEPGELLLIAAGRPAAFQANPFFAAHGPEPTYLAWAVGWVVVVLLIGI
ncbi:MAG TPA: ABC transporter permease subunit, partial [Candidatus Limnocylindrales bacterium]